MKPISLVLATISLLAGSVLAAAPAVAQTHDWSGFYAGVQAGWFNGTGTLTEPGGGEIGSWNLTGPFAGKYAGFNVQNGNFVYGVEGDINLARISGESSGVVQVVYEYGSEIETLGSLRGRAGFATGNALFFGTAGLAFATGCYWYEYDGPYEMEELSHLGFVVGVGAEYALSDSISFRKEIRFYSFPGQEVVLGEEPTDLVDYALSGVTASVGLTFHF
ncbi:MAG TPA: outer membrane beta-barrel protein [Devosiaceae bacterium]|nr:outer membrane beta-barrel protein [Devosiaceae bacterium]